MPAPEVSIIIVNWNTRQLLLDCIQSLLTHTNRTSIEIIVVDNASSDGSLDAVAEAYPDVKLIQNSDNLGFAKANNVGFAHAAGAALCLVNTDVLALDGVVDKLWDHLVAHPEVAVVGPKTFNRDGATRLNCRRFPSLFNAMGDYLWLKHVPVIGPAGRTLPEESFTRTHQAEVLSGCFLMVRTAAVAEVGPLDDAFFFYGEDTDWCRRFFDAGWGIVFLADAEAIHFGGGSSAAYPVTYYLTMEQADLRYWAKHHGKTAVTAYAAIKVIYHLISVGGWSFRWLAARGPRDEASLKIRGHATNLFWLVFRRNLVQPLGSPQIKHRSRHPA